VVEINHFLNNKWKKKKDNNMKTELGYDHMKKCISLPVHGLSKLTHFMYDIQLRM
jgi:hypothetical protein